MTLAYSYIRMSRPEQLKGDSLRRQLEDSHRFAKEHGLQLDDSLRDLGVSAFRGKHRQEGALARFLQHVREGRVPTGSVLIVESLDRLSRETVMDALPPFLDLVNAGIDIATLGNGQRYNRERLSREPMGLFMGLVEMMRANEESERKSDRVGKAWKKKHDDALAGKVVTARCRRWLQVVTDAKGKRHFKVIQKKADVVRRIFQLTADGVGRWALARMLNDERVPSLDGKLWHESSISRLLMEDAVLGVYQPYDVKAGVRKPRGEPIAGYYPAIVPAELVNRARAAMAERTGYAGRRGKHHGNLFNGTVYCACGARMRVRNHGIRRKNGAHGRSLACSAIIQTGRHLKAPNKTKARHFHYGRFEKAFLDAVREIDFGQFDRQHDEALQALDKALATASLAVAAKRKTLDRLITAFGDEPLPTVGERIKMLEGELQALRQEEQKLKEQRKHLHATKTSGDEHVATIERLRKKMAGADAAELYRIRAQLGQEIRRIVESVTFLVTPPDRRQFVSIMVRDPVKQPEGRSGIVNYWMTETDKGWEISREASYEQGVTWENPEGEAFIASIDEDAAPVPQRYRRRPVKGQRVSS